MKSLGESSVSRTNPRKPAVRRVLRSLCMGNATVLPAFLDHIAGGEQVQHRVYQSRYSVLAGLDVHPDVVLAGCLRCDRPDTCHPGPREKPRGALATEGPDKVLHRRARGEGHAVDLAAFEQL